MRFLLVEDHEIVRRGLRQLLVEAYPDAGFDEARDAAQAREYFMRGECDLVLLDISLPGRSGLELLAELRRLRADARVLVLSSHAEEEYAVQALKLGASGYLTKASAADETLVAARRILAGGRYVSAALAERLAAALGDPHHEAPHEALSPRELEVLRRVAGGQTIKEIATALSLSEKTVATYRTRLAEKLRLSTNVELARYAMRHGLAE